MNEKYLKGRIAMNLEPSDMSIQEKIFVICLYFSRITSDYPIYNGKRKDYYTKISETFDVKFNTLKNHQYAFDTLYDNNGHQGWHDKPLKSRNKFQAEIFNKCENVPTKETAEIVEKIMEELEADLSYWP